MRSSISGSASLEPTLVRPSLSSWSVTLPLLSVSMSANMSLITSTSSTDRARTPRTRMAFFLRRFMRENCLRRARTTSPRGTLGARAAWWSQGWSSTCCAVGRRRGSTSSIWRTRDLAAREMRGHGSRSKSAAPRRMARATPCSVSAQNGGTPHRRM
ncbi:Os03g0688450 [Oryza sativa Japonica Group]|uniref:Os03g0688450 protein n=1 Tax=Oryza sativa subsp. japonica TaxID=39947 RepID=A0A0P0W2D4_ORYSJ|nr:hypothetical protein EE612_019764 [Oryza sativa]BAS85826.1 Os03g0688450 [Oryza sativa Japonica Group]